VRRLPALRDLPTLRRPARWPPPGLGRLTTLRSPAALRRLAVLKRPSALGHWWLAALQHSPWVLGREPSLLVVGLLPGSRGLTRAA
jgi:hypothetical protein